MAITISTSDIARQQLSLFETRLMSMELGKATCAPSLRICARPCKRAGYARCQAGVSAPFVLEQDGNVWKLDCCGRPLAFTAFCQQYPHSIIDSRVERGLPARHQDCHRKRRRV